MAGFRITPRDQSVLCEVFLMRFAVASQIAGFCGFGSIGRCRTRVRALKENGYLRRIRLEGTGGSVIACAPKAAPIVSRILGIPLAEAKKACRKEPSLMQAEHAFAVSEFRRLLSQNGPKVSWLSERQCTHAYEANIGGVWRKRLVKPDGFFRALTNFGVKCFFVEIDLGSVSLERIRQKLEGYRLYFDEAFEDAYGEKDFGVLMVSNSRTRLDRIREIAPERPRLLLASMDDLMGAGVWSGSAWSDANGDQASILREELR